MSDLFTPVVSIAATRRRRFLWAAWWTAPPAGAPWRKPDASQGGARTRDQALRQAEQAAGRSLVEIEARWARAWGRMLVGEPPWTPTEQREPETQARPRRVPESPPGSIWQLLGVDARASVEQIKRAFRGRALTAHPDQGGDAESFRGLRRAYDEALRRRRRAAARPKRG